LTALEFLDVEPDEIGVMDRIDELALSLFAVRVMRMLFWSHLFGAVVSGLLAYVVFSLLPETATKGHIDSWPAVSVVAAVLGTIFSMLGGLIYWHVTFQRSLLEIDLTVERHPLWSTGVRRSPDDRELIRAEDDGAYKLLRKVS
jgi:H+/Cl- antiporter ClcA